jgi:hypothetical protein
MHRTTKTQTERETVSQNLETSQDPYDQIEDATDADDMAPVEDAAVLSALASRAYLR